MCKKNISSEKEIAAQNFKWNYFANVKWLFKNNKKKTVMYVFEV